jgi:hypothetical protein
MRNGRRCGQSLRTRAHGCTTAGCWAAALPRRAWLRAATPAAAVAAARALLTPQPAALPTCQRQRALVQVRVRPAAMQTSPPPWKRCRAAWRRRRPCARSCCRSGLLCPWPPWLVPDAGPQRLHARNSMQCWLGGLLMLLDVRPLPICAQQHFAPHIVRLWRWFPGCLSASCKLVVHCLKVCECEQHIYSWVHA